MDNIRLTYEVEGGDLTQAGEASAQVKQTLRKLGFDPDTIRRVSVCMYEGEINMVIHADGGEITVEITPEVLRQVADTCNIIKAGPRELSRDEIYDILMECL